MVNFVGDVVARNCARRNLACKAKDAVLVVAIAAAVAQKSSVLKYVVVPVITQQVADFMSAACGRCSVGVSSCTEAPQASRRGAKNPRLGPRF